MSAVSHKSKIVAVGIVTAFMLALVGAVATHSATAATDAKINWQIALTPSTAFPNATGKAHYQAKPGERELQIEVEHLVQLAGQKVTFYANGAKFGVAKVSSLGKAQIDRSTELGQAVPVIVHGSQVAARTSAGVLIVSGSF